MFKLTEVFNSEPLASHSVTPDGLSAILALQAVVKCPTNITLNGRHLSPDKLSLIAGVRQWETEQEFMEIYDE